MNGHKYEYQVAKYLRGHGYTGVTVTKGSGDFGVDVIAHKSGHKYAVQCKYYSNPVGLSAIQEAVAVQSNCNIFTPKFKYLNYFWRRQCSTIFSNSSARKRA